MKILVCKDYDAMSQKAAQLVASQVTLKCNSVLGLATGSTPIGMYQKLVEMYEKKIINFSQIRTFNLDEYCNISQSDSQSYYYFMQENFFRKVNLSQEQTNLPNGIIENLDTYCSDYDNLIKESGGIDLQILGIGNNAHIGFNEPSEYFAKGTHVVNLDHSTREANARFFNSIEDVPKQAITMGVGTIFKSKKIMLLASGEIKAQAVRDTVYGEIKPSVPSSILNLHSDVIMILDESAGALLDEKDYERV